MHYDIIVIGSGPAGLSAALTARARNKTVLVVGNRWQDSPLARAERVDNYLGLPSQSGADLLETFHAHAKEAGVALLEGRALSALPWNGFQVSVGSQVLSAGALILAPGVVRQKKFPGEAEYLGRGVSYCATCDAFFYRGRDVAVLGSGEYALHEVQALLPVAHSVTLLTGGAPLTAQFPPEVAVRTEAVAAILGEERVTGVQLKDGGTLEVSGVFVALGVAGSTALARKLGAEVNGSRIVVDDHMQTSLPGLYAAGDCTGGLLQVAKAVYEGAVAGTEAAKALRK